MDHEQLRLAALQEASLVLRSMGSFTVDDVLAEAAKIYAFLCGSLVQIEEAA